MVQQHGEAYLNYQDSVPAFDFLSASLYLFGFVNKPSKKPLRAPAKSPAPKAAEPSTLFSDDEA